MLSKKLACKKGNFSHTNQSCIAIAYAAINVATCFCKIKAPLIYSPETVKETNYLYTSTIGSANYADDEEISRNYFIFSSFTITIYFFKFIKLDIVY